jgi:CheY-like chemotaxis protein
MGGRIGVQSEAGPRRDVPFEVPLLKVLGDMPAREADLSGARLLLLSHRCAPAQRLSMLLPNWGLRVTTVETTQEALDRLRAAATQGPPWTYGVVLADLSSMRNTAIALHRNVARTRASATCGGLPGRRRRVPQELHTGATLLPRQAPDADLARGAVAPRIARRRKAQETAAKRAAPPPKHSRRACCWSRTTRSTCSSRSAC